MIQITISQTIPESGSVALLASAGSAFENAGFSDEEAAYVKEQFAAKASHIALCKSGRWYFVQQVEPNASESAAKEKMRCGAAKMHQAVVQQKIRSLTIVDLTGSAGLVFAFAEGMALSNYQFLKYSGKKDEKRHSLSELSIAGDADTAEVECLNRVLEAVCKARDLVNEPASALVATPAWPSCGAPSSVSATTGAGESRPPWSLSSS